MVVAWEEATGRIRHSRMGGEGFHHYLRSVWSVERSSRRFNLCGWGEIAGACRRLLLRCKGRIWQIGTIHAMCWGTLCGLKVENAP